MQNGPISGPSYAESLNEKPLISLAVIFVLGFGPPPSRALSRLAIIYFGVSLRSLAL